MVVKMRLRRVRLVVPSPAVVELHPVILSIFDLTSVLEGLGQEVTQVVVVRGILEAQVADICEVLVEFLCEDVRKQ